MSNKTEINLPEEINAMADSGKNRGQIEGYLKYAHDMSNADAKTAVQNVLGKGSAGASVDKAEVTQFIRENFGTMEKKELIAGMCDVTGGKESSMNHLYNYIRFAQEYAKQEVDAALNS